MAGWAVKGYCSLTRSCWSANQKQGGNATHGRSALGLAASGTLGIKGGVHDETSAPSISAVCRRRRRSARALALCFCRALSDAVGALARLLYAWRLVRHPRAADGT